MLNVINLTTTTIKDRDLLLMLCINVIKLITSLIFKTLLLGNKPELRLKLSKNI